MATLAARREQVFDFAGAAIAAMFPAPIGLICVMGVLGRESQGLLLGLSIEVSFDRHLTAIVRGVNRQRGPPESAEFVAAIDHSLALASAPCAILLFLAACCFPFRACTPVLRPLTRPRSHPVVAPPHLPSPLWYRRPTCTPIA